MMESFLKLPPLNTTVSGTKWSTQAPCPLPITREVEKYFFCYGFTN